MAKNQKLVWQKMKTDQIPDFLSCYNDDDTSQWSRTDIEDSISMPSVTGWALYENSATLSILGFILFQQVDDELDILSLAVSPNTRNQGYGALLLQRIYPAGEKIFLEVAANNSPALRLYEKEGFIRTGLRPLYYKQGNIWVDAVTMTRFLMRERLQS